MVLSTVDLHLHTTCSDGNLSPVEMINKAVSVGLNVISITDHDSTEALDESIAASNQFSSLSIIPGIELSTDIPGNEIHMLGYFIDYKDENFQAVLREFREGRVGRAKEMVDKLGELGLPLDWERVLELAEGAVGRPHIAQAMVEKGYITYPQEAFNKYIGRNGLAYAERAKLTPEESVELIVGVGGLPVLAHPHVIDGVEKLLPGLAEAGLVGMEVYYGEYSKSEISAFESMAGRYGLLPCGGSDYHAFGTPGEVQPGTVGPSIEIAKKLYALSGRELSLSL